MRTFIAIELPDDIKARLTAAQEMLRKTRAKVSWTNSDNIHLTLKFLGEISEDQCAAVGKALAELSVRQTPFVISVAGAGGFPNTKVPRVLWIGCEDPSGALESLHLEVEAAMEELGFPPEARAFTAHLTLGRVKIPKPNPALTSALESLKNESFGTMRVHAIHLFRSQLHPDGAIYTKISSHSLLGDVKS